MVLRVLATCALSLGAVMTGGCYESHGLGGPSVDAGPRRIDASPGVDAGFDAGRDAGVRREPVLVWVLIHPTDAPMGPGLFLFDEANQEVVRRLPLPDGVTSPHALAWDGTSLWLGGIDSEPGVREIDPEDGRVLSMWPGVQTEGVATEGGRYWYAAVADAFQPLVEVTRDGTRVASFSLTESTIQDLVAADSALYYLVNDAEDRVMRVDPETGEVTSLASSVDLAPYALGFDGTSLVVAARGTARRFDPRTGGLVRESAFGLPGWVTAIAYVR